MVEQKMRFSLDHKMKETKTEVKRGAGGAILAVVINAKQCAKRTDQEKDQAQTSETSFVKAEKDSIPASSFQNIIIPEIFQ